MTNSLLVLSAHPFFKSDSLLKSRKNIFNFLFLLIIIPTILSCSKQEHSRANQIVVALDSNPTQLDPRLSQDSVSNQIQSFLFSPLLSFDKKGEIELILAKKWEHLDPLSHTIEIREKIFFHNGKELTSEDIKYTFESLRDPLFGSPKSSMLKDLKEIQLISKYKLTFKLKRPSASFAECLMIGIVPKSASKDFQQKPIGTGPFKFSHYKNDETLELISFKKYFKKPPNFKKLTFKIIPEETIRILELESGGVDFIQNGFSPDILPRLEKNPNLKISKRLGTNFSYIGFNLEDPILSNKLVRKAIAHAINKKPIIKYILKDLVVPSNSLLHPNHWAFNPNIQEYKHDIQYSNELLDKAGYIDPDGEGPLPRFTLTFKTSQNELRLRIATVLADQLSSVGIKIRIRSYEWGTFFSDIRKGNFQIYSLTWVGISDPDIYRFIFHSNFFSPKGLNRGKYHNSKIDKLLESASLKQNKEYRKTKYHIVQKILANDLPYINLWHSVNVAVFSRKIKGYNIYQNEDLISLSKITIENRP